MKKIFILIIASTLIAGVSLGYRRINSYPSKIIIESPEESKTSANSKQEEAASDEKIEQQKSVAVVSEKEQQPIDSPAEAIQQIVPFISQAPLAEWNREEFQDGCEEASAIMAMRWAKNNSSLISKEQARAEILQLVDFEKKNYQEFRDRSSTDTAQMIRDFYHYQLIETKDIASVDQIIGELAQGKILIIPMNGQKLGNPNFTPPGPENHMLVVVGYDPEKKQFITNDPGTRKGEGYKYGQNILFEAIRDYPTGNHEPNPVVHKKMIVISKNSA